MRLKFETFCKIWLILYLIFDAINIIFDAINKFIITYVFFIQTVVNCHRNAYSYNAANFL